MNKTILIVCEGQTEKLYFESFPVIGARIKIVDLEGQSKLKLIELAQAIVESIEGITFDEIWCVFDMDVKHGADEFADFDNAIHKALELGYKVAYSNDVFELWFYLHYDFTDAQHLRTFYYERLSERFKINYVKEGKKRGFSSRIYSIFIKTKTLHNRRLSKGRKNCMRIGKTLYIMSKIRLLRFTNWLSY